MLKFSYDPTQLSKPRKHLVFLRHLPLWIQLLGIAAVIVSLARPQKSASISERIMEGIDIMLVIDVSGSMELEDFNPDRLTVAKKNAAEFIRSRKGDRLGLVLFAEDAFSYAPLTLDYELLLKLVNDINSTILPKQGTAMGTAVSIGINRLKDSESASKIMIVFTDGANNRGEIDPITAARLSKIHGIKVYTIGIGKPYFERKTVRGLEKVVSDLDEKTLKKVAEITGGKYFKADEEVKMTEVMDEISRMEKSKIKDDIYKDVTDLYPFFLKTAIVCFILAYLLMNTFIYNPLEL